MRGVLRRACCLLLAQSNSARIAKTTRVLLFCQLLFGQFTPGAYGSVSRLYGYGSRLYGRIAGPPDLVARDCDFAALLVSDIRLAARLGPETASNRQRPSPRREILSSSSWSLMPIYLLASRSGIHRTQCVEGRPYVGIGRPPLW